MTKFLCKLWNADRSKKKAFMCEASIDLIVKKGMYISFIARFLVLFEIIIFYFSKGLLSSWQQNSFRKRWDRDRR